MSRHPVEDAGGFMSGVSKIVIVGADMFLGRLLGEELPELGFEVSGVDVQDGGRRLGRLSDRDHLAAAFAGAQGVIDVSKLDQCRWNHDFGMAVAGLDALWQAARTAGVKRVTTLVPEGVVGFYRRSATLDHLSVARPDSPDGLVGAVAESMASLYAYKFAISALCIRMGACRPEPLDERMLSTWISPGDFVRLIHTAMTADYSFEVVYGISRNTWGWWDNSNAHRLGYRPRDRSDVFADALIGRRSSNLIENVFQGGPRVAANFAGDLRRIP